MITIGTRGSELALVQAHWVASELGKHGHESQIQIIKTKGDVVQDRFDKIEGKGFFTREIEEALLAEEVDLAVHCLKDLPTLMPEGLRIGAITEREEPYDLLVSTQPFEILPNGQPDLNGRVIGTSSSRRVQGLQRHYPTASFVPLRGNVPTRLEKLKRGDAEIIVLAAAGINRLSLPMDDFFVVQAVPPLLVPAPGQGALALQVREHSTLDLGFFHHEETAACVGVERGLLRALDGGCQLPFGVMVRCLGPGAYHLELFIGAREPGGPSLHFSINGVSVEAVADQARAVLIQKGFLEG